VVFEHTTHGLITPVCLAYGCFLLHEGSAKCVCVCVCMRVRVRACACEGIEGALPLGVLPPQERASLPRCLSTLGAFKGRLGRLSRPVPIHAQDLLINPNASVARPLPLGYLNAPDTPQGGQKRSRYAMIYVLYGPNYMGHSVKLLGPNHMGQSVKLLRPTFMGQSVKLHGPKA
jgi:hypothetical protein